MNQTQKTIHQEILFRCTRFGLQPSEVDEMNQLLPKVNNWNDLLEEMELRGIAVLFFRHTREHRLPVEKGALLALRALAMRHAGAARARYAAINDISRVFAEAQLPWVALKGLALAPTLYADESDRPMRDMDILVPKNRLNEAADLMRDLGYNLPEMQPSKYMRGSHQLPNAELQKDGFLISVEVHHNAIGQDAVGSLDYADIDPEPIRVRWHSLNFLSLPHEQMLHQLARHLEGFHPAGKMKLINVLDVVGYAQEYHQVLNWAQIRKRQPHIINTLRCLHLITPLSVELQRQIGGVRPARVNDVGDIMLPLSWLFSQRYSWSKRLGLLFAPSDWWLHLYYGVDPANSLLWTKTLTHPFKVMQWLGNRLLSRLLGG